MDRLERWSARCEDMLGQAEAQREAGAASPHDALAAIVAELAAEGDDDDGEQDAAVELPDSPAIDGEGDGRG